jgi:hypothetical protein
MATFRHAEAFRLMRYRCKTCRFVETIWNSRDGVVPFGVDCVAVAKEDRAALNCPLVSVHLLNARVGGGVLPACGGEALHVDWHADACAPEYDPTPGERYFRDGLPAEARAIMRARIERMRGEYPISDEEAAELVRRAGETGASFRSAGPARRARHGCGHAALPGETGMDEAILIVTNNHVASCGPAPALGDIHEYLYCGYFENQWREQWLFIVDRAGLASLRGGDVECGRRPGWPHVLMLVDVGGEARATKADGESVLLGLDEQAWLNVCWSASRPWRVPG